MHDRGRFAASGARHEVLQQHQAAVTGKNNKHNGDDVPLNQFSFAGGTLRFGPGSPPAAIYALHLTSSPLRGP